MAQCDCPLGASITTIRTSDCPLKVGQLQRAIFQRTKNGNALNWIDAAAALLLATYTALINAADSTKIVVTPFFEEPDLAPGGARTSGGGNASVGGIERIIGRNPTAFTANWPETQQYIIEDIKGLECDKLSVFFIDEFDQIIAQGDDGENPNQFRGFPIRSLFTDDFNGGKFDTTGLNAFQFQLVPNWSDKMALISPTDFSPLEEL